MSLGCTLHFNIKLRLLYLALGVATFLIAYSVGAAVNMTKAEIELLKRQFSEQIKNIDQTGIFINNVKIALGMFVPGFGIGLGMFSGFSTGMVFNAIVETSPILKNIPPLIILITPFGILEVFAYGIALSRSGILVYDLVTKKPWREYVVVTLIEIGIVIVILLVGAIIEWQTITQLGGFRNPPNL